MVGLRPGGSPGGTHRRGRRFRGGLEQVGQQCGQPGPARGSSGSSRCPAGRPGSRRPRRPSSPPCPPAPAPPAGRAGSCVEGGEHRPPALAVDGVRRRGPAAGSGRRARRRARPRSSRSSGSGSAARTRRRRSRSRQALTTIRCSQVVTAASPRKESARRNAEISASWRASAASSGSPVVRRATAHSRSRCRANRSPKASGSPATWASSSARSSSRPRRRARRARRRQDRTVMSAISPRKPPGTAAARSARRAGSGSSGSCRGGWWSLGARALADRPCQLVELVRGLGHAGRGGVHLERRWAAPLSWIVADPPSGAAEVEHQRRRRSSGRRARGCCSRCASPAVAGSPSITGRPRRGSPRAVAQGVEVRHAGHRDAVRRRRRAEREGCSAPVPGAAAVLAAAVEGEDHRHDHGEHHAITIAIRSQPRPSLPVWTSLRSSSSSTKGQNPGRCRWSPPRSVDRAPRGGPVAPAAGPAAARLGRGRRRCRAAAWGPGARCAANRGRSGRSSNGGGGAASSRGALRAGSSDSGPLAWPRVDLGVAPGSSGAWAGGLAPVRRAVAWVAGSGASLRWTSRVRSSSGCWSAAPR